MSNIPCIKDKCILYPVCKNKTTVKCQDLYDHMMVILLNEKRHTKKVYKRLWQSVTFILPRLLTIQSTYEGRFIDMTIPIS